MTLKPKQIAMGAAALIAGAILAVPPSAGASGTSETKNGCYAQWYNTYIAGRCFNSKLSDKRLNLNCSWGGHYRLPWRTVQGTVNPFQDYECNYGVNGAFVEDDTYVS